MMLDLARADRVQGALFDEPDDARSQAPCVRSISSIAASAATRSAMPPPALPAAGPCSAAVGPGLGLVEEIDQGHAGDVQFARGIRRRQTDVPHRLQGAALHRAGERFLSNGPARRVRSSRTFAPRPMDLPSSPSPVSGTAGKIRWPSNGFSPARSSCRALGLDGALSRPHAGPARGERFRCNGSTVHLVSTGPSPHPKRRCANVKASPRLNRTGGGDDDPTIIEPLP